MKRNPLFNAMMLVAAIVIADVSAVVRAEDMPNPVGQTSDAQPSIADIVTQQTQLRGQAIAARGPFKGMSKREREDLVRHQDRVLYLLNGHAALEELSPVQRTELFNELESVKAAVTKAEDERMVCEYTRVVGSNRVQSVCMTAQKRQEKRDRVQHAMRRERKCDFCGSD